MSHPHNHAHAPKGSGPDRFREFKSYAKEELIAHLPFTLIGVACAVALVLVSVSVTTLSFGEEEFHLAHFAHIFFSAAAGSAIFRSYRESALKAVPITLVSSISLCSLSDVLIPYAGLAAFGKHAGVHLCAAEHPWIVLACAASGVALGFFGNRFFKHCNRPFHLVHILIATTAAVLYILSFVGTIGLGDVPAIAGVVFVSLVVPCLLGDVTLPLLFVRLREEYLHEKVHHSR